MHIPKKHRVEGVEKAIKEAQEHEEEEESGMPGVNIIVNIGGDQMSASHRKPMRRKVTKEHKKSKPEPKKRKGLAGPMEEALKGAY
tara:strand:- start:230 stop:487 length:258 start_codon:yes stop_codon:yes gene_type:complete